MKIIEGKEREYADWREKNADPYGRRCFTFAEEWADRLEARMVDGIDPTAVIAAHAEEDARDADTDGITGFMYGMSVQILARAWLHGDALRRWHNLEAQIGDEGERANEGGATLNPAVMRIS